MQRLVPSASGQSYGTRCKKPVAVTVTSDTPLDMEACAGVVEVLVKHILYQRGQIPVPFDALQREARLQRSISQAHLRDAALPLNARQNSVSRKEEIMKHKLQRKRQQWLCKVDKFLLNFNSMKESLHNELKSGSVRGVKVILGSSVMTGRESYFIRLPEDYSSQSSTQPAKPHNRGLKLFRNLVTNEALLKVMNQPCGVQRIWVMVQKSTGLKNTTDHTKSLGANTTAVNVIHRPEYSEHQRTTKVEINIQHRSVSASMDLTPTVGSGITLHNLGTKRSLYLSSPSVFHSCSSNRNQGMLTCTYLEKESDNGTSDSDRHKMLPPSLIRNSDCTYNKSILKTPVKLYKEDIIPMVETPVHSSFLKVESFTPSKQLASRLGTFNLSDGTLDTTWYQIDCLISGFRDMCQS
ncbi:uncharacterized protein LOC123514284 [Portunus trituberculatus]|uniref:uncharacterized protein LOC123514284 n=1 Tax=Portunus trituberculatus TaxID=210409 RepID=UPI001E1CE905|nr:uncharacterized protein LOC123514284 [Portunus trituberculatus]